MSTYLAPAYDPVTGTVREATWIDDYFGRHRYGVRFDEGGPVWRPEEAEPAAAGREVVRLRARLEKAREALHRLSHYHSSPALKDVPQTTKQVRQIAAEALAALDGKEQDDG